MYSTFVSVLLLYQCYSSVALDFVIILASDKESLKKSLVQVDQFLKKVGRRIDTERDFLQSVGRRNADSGTTLTTRDNAATVDRVSDEDYSNLWFGGNKFGEKPENINSRKKDGGEHTRKGRKDYSNFYKAIATLDDKELNKGTTMNLVNAVQDLKGLVETDVDIKRSQDATKKDTLQKIQETLKKKYKESKIFNKADIKKSKRDNDDNIDDFDVFGGMEFPEDSNLPSGITTKAVPTTSGSPPDVLDGLLDNVHLPGPDLEDIATPATTTDVDEPLLKPENYRYNTTHNPVPTFGDIHAPPHIPKQYLTTTPAPDAFVARLKGEMAKFHMGVFSIATLNILHMLIWKAEDDARHIVSALVKTYNELDRYHRFNDFGQPTQEAVSRIVESMQSIQFDQFKSEAVLLHNGLLHRRELFSADVNSLLDYIDTLYSRQETDHLLESLEALDDYKGPQELPQTVTDTIVENILSPWSRLKGTPRGNVIKEALKRAITNHFYPNNMGYPEVREGRRAITIALPVEFLRGYKPVGVTPVRAPQPNFRSGNIEVYKIETRRDDLPIYKYDLKTLFTNFMRNKNNEASRSRVSTAKPLFNKQLKSHLNIQKVDKPVNTFNRMNERATPLRINLNAKVTSQPVNNNRIMIIRNNNQAKSNIINPRAVFRSGDPYEEFEVVNMNDSLVPGADQFQVEMYPDVPMMVSPAQSALNFQIEGDKLNLQVAGDEKVIVINKGNDVPVDRFREDMDLKMSSTSSSSSALRRKKHHKKHHKKHKRTHGHNSLKEKLARIKKIVKMYRTGHRKHKRHHRHNKHKKTLKGLSIKDDTFPPSPITRGLNATKKKPASDRRFQLKDSLSTARGAPASVAQTQHTTQVYAVRSNFIKSLRRHMIDGVNKVGLRLETEESGRSNEEITLRKNLYQALSLGRGQRGGDARRGNKRRLRGPLRDSSATDEESQLKNNIYSYFNNIQSA